ncbi:hypothetical protein HK102_003094 [Quaeritorhiza haematococci]|nr:hypothetical protein HK102_003094 [Quaeritorhiza haematococci]
MRVKFASKWACEVVHPYRGIDVKIIDVALSRHTDETGEARFMNFRKSEFWRSVFYRPKEDDGESGSGRDADEDKGKEEEKVDPKQNNKNEENETQENEEPDAKLTEKEQAAEADEKKPKNEEEAEETTKTEKKSGAEKPLTLRKRVSRVFQKCKTAFKNLVWKLQGGNPKLNTRKEDYDAFVERL